MPNIGTPELIVILIIVILVFGVGRLPQVSRSLGGALREVRKGLGGEEDALPEQSAPPSPLERWSSRLEKALDEIATLDEGLTLAVMLNTLLEVFNVSQYRLAEETGVDRSTINRLLKGKTKRPQKETMLRILSVFPALPPHWQEELLTLAGYPSAEAVPPLTHPPQVYLSCHGEDLSIERRTVTTIFSGPRSPFSVEVGDETWPLDGVTASVRHSDYLVMAQGWRWVSLRRVEHQSAQESEQVTGLYFQKQGLSPQPEVERFLEEVGLERWQPFSDADALAEQVWTGLWEAMTREARAGRVRVPLRSMAAIYLVTRLLTGEETTLPALLQRLAAGEEASAGEGEPEQEPVSRVWRQERPHPLEPEMIRIPGGRFRMGTDRITLELAGVKWESWFEAETPQHPVYLPDYAIGKYPVTNAEFTHFIEEGGYRNPDYWTVAGWKAKENWDWTQPSYWKDNEFNLCRYVHLNPVTAGLVSDPAEWPYSNYLEWIETRPGTLVDRAFIRQFFPTPEAYVAFVQAHIVPHIAQQLQPYLLDDDDYLPESYTRSFREGSGDSSER